MLSSDNMTCPMCSMQLELKQINFKTAVYICVNLKCPYPIGAECIEVERRFEDMNKYSKNHDQLKNKKCISSQDNNHETQNTLLECDSNKLFNEINSNFNQEQIFNENDTGTTLSKEKIGDNHSYSAVNADELDDFLEELIKSS